MSSDAPIIFKRKQPKQARATRQKTPEIEGSVDAEDAGVESPATLASKLKNKIKKSQTKSRLSFGGDDEEGEGELFKVKKSSLSRKVGLGTHPASLPQHLEQATISPNDAPKYDAAYLSELKASTPNARPRASAQDSQDTAMVVDLDMPVLTGEDADAFENSLAIPSESSIRVAKEKRERLRQTKLTGEEDYISLSLVKRDDEPQGPHPESRLMREEDELGGDDEFAEYTSAQERIALGKKARKREAAQRRDAMKEMIDDAEEVDEETAEWEQEQLRRGGHQTPPQTAAKAKPVYKPAPIPAVTPIPTLNLAVARLAQDLARLTTSHAQNSSALSSLAQERAEVDEREKEMRDLVEKAETKRAWFGSFKEWVESVAGFLDEKYPLLEELEVEHVSLLKEKSAMTKKRRRLDDTDDLSFFIGPLPAEPQAEDTMMDEVDDFGRIVPKPDPVTQRKERRTARLNRRAQRRARQASRSTTQAEEGYSTDSSMAPQDQDSYTVALDDLAVKKKGVLADVKAEEFKNPGKGRWAAWREQYSDSYVGAWGGLGVVSVWEFWVRLECVAWDCIEDKRSLDSFKWYQGLYEYSRPGEQTAVEQRALGPDGDLVASMISTAVVPMICKRLDGGALDVLSLRQIRRMVDLAEEIEASIEEGSPKFQLLLKSVMRLFEMAITETEQLIGQVREANRSTVPSFDPEAIPARRRFLARQVKLLKNLLIWRKYTGERFGLGALATRLVEGCIVGIAESGWDVGGQEVASTVAGLLPPELHPPQLKQILQLSA